MTGSICPTRLTRREREIMDILHRRGRASAQEVLDELPDTPSYSTVRALLRILEERGHVEHVVEDQRYVYLPTVAPAEARRSALAHLVSTFFAGSAAQAVATLVESPHTRLSPEAPDQLADLIARAKQEGR
jgi:predicted transcriptional regulator